MINPVTTNKKKIEINKIIKILKSENIIDSKTARLVKNKLLSVYYSNLFNMWKDKFNHYNWLNKELNKIEKNIEKNKAEISKLRTKINNLHDIRWWLYLRNNVQNFKNHFSFRSKNKHKKTKIKELLSNNTKDLDITYKEIKQLQLQNAQLKNDRKILLNENKINVNPILNMSKSKNTLKDYIKGKWEWWINFVFKRIDSENIRENDLQKEELKKIILDNYKNMELYRHNDEIFNMAKSLESYIDENFENIMGTLDWIQKKIIELTLKKSKIKEKIKTWNIDDVIRLKEEEYEIQLEIKKLQKEYDEIKYDIEEKLKAYDWSTYEEKKTEFLNSNKKNGD